MQILTILLLSIGLATDALTVSICNGVASPKMSRKKQLIISITFGLFQGLMPLVGFFIGGILFEGIGQWFSLISFVILSILGIKMITSKDDDDAANELSAKVIILQGIATSIDALVVGLVLANQELNISQVLLNVSVIGFITFVLCFIGMAFSKKIGTLLNKKAKVIGGVMLLLVAIMILLESLLSM